jgi:hypothetical protein
MCGWASCKLTARHYAEVDVAVHHDGASLQPASRRSQSDSLHRIRYWPGPRLPAWYDGAASQPAANALLCEQCALHAVCLVPVPGSSAPPMPVGKVTGTKGKWAMYSIQPRLAMFPRASLFVSRPLQACRRALWTVGPLPACHLSHAHTPMHAFSPLSSPRPAQLHSNSGHRCRPHCPFSFLPSSASFVNLISLFLLFPLPFRALRVSCLFVNRRAGPLLHFLILSSLILSNPLTFTCTPPEPCAREPLFVEVAGQLWRRQIPLFTYTLFVILFVPSHLFNHSP